VIIGGGITRACVASTLLLSEPVTDNTAPRLSPPRAINVDVDVFDQGRSSPGGHASTRRAAVVVNSAQRQTTTTTGNKDGCVGTRMTFDHGCQFFRGDMERFRTNLLERWLRRGFATEWKGVFRGESPRADLLGMPGVGGLYYVGANGGMKSLVDRIIRDALTPSAIWKVPPPHPLLITH